METTRNKGPVATGDTPELMSLVELQKFIADELSSTGGDGNFSRSFTPLTDGLGLESPKRREAPAVSTPKKRTTLPPPPAPEARSSKREPAAMLDLSAVHPAKEIAPVDRRKFFDAEDVPPPDPLVEPRRAPVFSDEPEVDPVPVTSTPPPMPEASVFRRFQAGVVDQVFVLSLWAGALLITSQMMAQGNKSFVDRIASDFTNPVFLRFALLEFFAIWTCYLVFGIGLVGASLGMWAWGLRLSYQGGSILKRLVRIAISLILVPTILPSFLLVIRLKGRNLLDYISGSRMYRVST